VSATIVETELDLSLTGQALAAVGMST
jgi:hypothetical protein